MPFLPPGRAFQGRGDTARREMAVAPLRRVAQNPAYRVTLTPLFTGAGTAAHGPAGGVPGEKRFSRPPPIRRPLPLVAPYLAAAFPQELNNLGKIAWSGCQIPNSWYKSRMEFVWVVPRAALFSKAAGCASEVVRVAIKLMIAVVC